jgi:hypothetical protein
MRLELAGGCHPFADSPIRPADRLGTRSLELDARLTRRSRTRFLGGLELRPLHKG